MKCFCKLFKFLEPKKNLQQRILHNLSLKSCVRFMFTIGCTGMDANIPDGENINSFIDMYIKCDKK